MEFKHTISLKSRTRCSARSGCGRPPKDIVATAQLLDVPQALELGRVDDGDTQRVDLDVAVNAVAEHLQEISR